MLSSTISQIRSPYAPLPKSCTSEVTRASAAPEDTADAHGLLAPPAADETPALSLGQKATIGLIAGAAVLGAMGCSGPPPASLPPRGEVPSVSQTVIMPEAEAPSILTTSADTPPASTQSKARTSALQLENLEIYDGLRVDVVRSIYVAQTPSTPLQNPAPAADPQAPTSPSPQSGGVTRTVKQRELSPFGVDVGNGLFYDLSGNLTFNPARVSESFRSITVDPPGLLNSTTITRSGSEIRIDPPGAFNSTTINTVDGRTIIDLPGPFNEVIVRQTGDTTTISPPTIPGVLNPVTVVQQGDTISYDPPGFFNRTVLTRDASTTRIAVPGWANDVTISRQGDTTRMAYPGWGNDVTVTQSGDRTTIDPHGLGNSIIVTRHGDQVRVDPPGWANSVTITITK